MLPQRKTFSLLFFIRLDRVNHRGEAPIYLRITVDTERVNVSLNRSILPKNWNSVKGCAKPGKGENESINDYLQSYRRKVYQAKIDLEAEHIPVTAIILKNKIQDLDTSNKMILELYDEHNRQLEEAIGKGIAPLTVERHKTSRKHIAEFIMKKYGRSDMYLHELTPDVIDKYHHYLRTVRNCGNNSTVKYIKNLGKIVRIALDNGWIKVNPMRKFKPKLEEVEKEFLNEQELRTIIEKEIPIRRTAVVRDVFLFQCFTGLAYADVKTLKHSDIVTDNRGNKWIKKRRQKSKQRSQIPLMSFAQALLGKYANDEYCIDNNVLLPVFSNQRMNTYLKEIADICGITKNLTTHVARHTFATTVTLANQVSMESVSKMLGHASINMTKHYAKILDSKILSEMNPLLDNFNPEILKRKDK